MNIYEIKKEVNVKTTSGPWCPVCGSPMYEADRRSESYNSLIWFECGRHGCNGQWLQRQRPNKVC